MVKIGDCRCQSTFHYGPRSLSLGDCDARWPGIALSAQRLSRPRRGGATCAANRVDECGVIGAIVEPSLRARPSGSRGEASPHGAVAFRARPPSQNSGRIALVHHVEVGRGGATADVTRVGTMKEAGVRPRIRRSRARQDRRARSGWRFARAVREPRGNVRTEKERADRDHPAGQPAVRRGPSRARRLSRW
jgi:hypothetical protein